MINFSNEQALSLTQAAKLLPSARKGKAVSLSCLWRWMVDGVKTPAGSIVRLEAVRLGGRWLTSAEALERFAQRQTPDVEAERPCTPRSAGLRRRAAERAGKKLDAVGI